MPRKAKDPAVIEAEYEAWLASAESMAINEFIDELMKIKYDNSTVDISDDWTQFLIKLHNMVQVLKIPGRKAKSYDQQYIRTMFFENVETIKIDDFFFEIPNSCKVDMVNCKDSLYQISTFFNDIWGMKDSSNYTTYKKDLLKMLKKFETQYNKHMKTTYKDMSAIHATAMGPLTKLLEANKNFHELELMI